MRNKLNFPEVAFKDEPEARALYEKMIATMREANSLSYKSDYKWESKGKEIGRCTYTIWMKKPNYFLVETIDNRGEKRGTLVGDGNDLWIYWPGNRPRFSTEDEQGYEKTRSNVYMTEATPVGKHSIGHKTELLGAGMSMPIIDPSTFHGYTDSLQPYIDGIKSKGTEMIEDEQCDVIEVSIMKGQRTWQLWLSEQDHLPRKLKEVIRVAYDIIKHEQWSEVTIDAGMPMDKFAWKPPEGWQQWSLPSPEERLLKPGQEAPDFELLSSEGRKIKLSGYRGKLVWLVIWRVGCPPCREEMPYLEEIYNKLKSKGLVVLGFNFADEKEIAGNFIREHSLTFPNILDTSDAARMVGFDGYKMSGVPLNYIIDKDGKVVDTWYGYEEGHKRAISALEKAGLKLDEQ